MKFYQMIEAGGIIFQWLALYMSGRAMYLFRNSMFDIRYHWEVPSIVLSRAIFLHFFFGILDGTYWQIAWSASYSSHSLEEWLFTNGIVANIPFRHLGVMLVGYLHLSARATQDRENLTRVHYEMFIVTVFALTHVWWLGT